MTTTPQPAPASVTITLTDAERFFYQHAGWSYDPQTQTPEEGRARGALALAAAEAEAGQRGWKVERDIDEDADTTPRQDHPVSGNPQWVATLNSRTGTVLWFVGGVDFATRYEVTPVDDPYARVVAAELAYTAL